MTRAFTTCRFWIGLALLALASTLFAVRYYKEANPLVDLEITTTRGAVSVQAHALAAWSGAVPAHLLAALCVAAFAAALYSRLAHGIGRQGRYSAMRKGSE